MASVSHKEPGGALEIKSQQVFDPEASRPEIWGCDYKSVEAEK